MMTTNHVRYFSQEDKKKNDYESGFQNLMNDGKVSKEEQERLQKRRDEKNEQTKQEQEDTEKLREQRFKEGEENFEDFIAGK